MIRVKICAIQDEKELETAVHAGADAVGFLVGQKYPSGDFILPERAGRLAGMLPPFVTPVLVTHLTDPQEIIELIDRTMITTLQLHGGSTPEQIQPVREYLDQMGKIIVAMHVGDRLPGEELIHASAYEEFADAFLLDTFDPVSGKVGGTGKTHNWKISSEFVRSSGKRVILAGGLNTENLEKAIQSVQPFGVDVNTSLRPLGTLDAKLAQTFVQVAHNSHPEPLIAAPQSDVIKK